MKLEITKEKVLEAASKCSQAKETLKTLFPEVFEEDEKLRTSTDAIKSQTYNSIFILRESKSNTASGDYDYDFILRTADGGEEHSFNSFVLSGAFNWSIKIEDGTKYLIPTRK